MPWLATYNPLSNKFIHACKGTTSTYVYSDVDECATGVDECDHHCHNNIASYTCSCNGTYTLNPDGLHCDGMLLPCMIYTKGISSRPRLGMQRA